MSSLRVLALGDAHIQTSNINEIDIFLTNLKVYIEDHIDEIDVCCILGDSLHDHARLHITPLNKAIEYVKLVSSYKPTYVLVGNHCAINNSIYLSTDHWLNCLKGWANVTVIDDVTIQTIKEQKVVFCPYVPDGRFIEALNTKHGEWEDARCIFAHQTIRGAKMGSIICKDADEWLDSNPFLVCGHIHNSQWLGPNMYYTGSILQVAIDESPNKHIALVTVTSNKVAIDEIDLCLPKKVIIDVSIEELNSGEYIIPSEPNTKYTLYVSGNYDDFGTFRKSSTYKNLCKLAQIYRGQKGIKFKPRKIDLEKEQDKIQELKERKQQHFNDLLRDSIEQDKDQRLYSFYRHMVYNDEDDLSAMLNDMLVISKKSPDESSSS